MHCFHPLFQGFDAAFAAAGVHLANGPNVDPDLGPLGR
jgi:hypothetical protein